MVMLTKCIDSICASTFFLAQIYRKARLDDVCCDNVPAFIEFETRFAQASFAMRCDKSITQAAKCMH